jgi:hypothetical protein
MGAALQWMNTSKKGQKLRKTGKSRERKRLLLKIAQVLCDNNVKREKEKIVRICGRGGEKKGGERNEYKLMLLFGAENAQALRDK